MSVYHQLRAKRALKLFKAVTLRTRRVLSTVQEIVCYCYEQKIYLFADGNIHLSMELRLMTHQSENKCDLLQMTPGCERMIPSEVWQLPRRYRLHFTSSG